MNACPTPVNEAARIAQLHTLDLLDTDPESIFDGFTRLAARLTDSPVALLSLVDTDRQWVKSAVGMPQGSESPRCLAFCAHAICAPEFFEVADLAADPRFASHPWVMHGLCARYAAAPLVMPGGLAVGTLCVVGRTAGRLGESQRLALVELAASIVDVLTLRERESKLRQERALREALSLTELVPLGMFSTDAAGEVIHGNAHWVRMMGAGHMDELLGTAWANRIHPDSLAPLASGWQAAVAARSSFAGVLRTRACGTTASRWIKFRVSPLDDEALAPVAFIGTTIDVTETVELQTQLQDKNRLLASIIENLPCGLMVFDAQLQHVVSNTTGRQMLHLTDERFAQPDATFASLIGDLDVRGETRAGKLQDVVEVARTGPRRQRFERITAEGEVMEVQASAMPDGGLIAIYTDVTSERRGAAELATSEARLARAVGAASLGLWEYDLGSREVFLARSWARLVGLPEHDVVTDGWGRRDVFPSEELARLDLALRQLVKGEITHISLEHRLRTAGGDYIWVHTEAEVSGRDARGRVLKVVGTSKDITKRREADDALRAALAAADQASRAKSSFLATMSHEIRTPLNGVIGLTQVLSGADLPPMESDSVAMIDSCAKSLLSLVDNILDFSRIEAGQLTLEEVPTDLRALIHEVGDVFSVRAADKGLRFGLTWPATLPCWIRADAGRLRQILLNLLGNALKFTTQGGFSLTVSAGEVPGTVAFAVTDTGIGISEPDQARLFTRFTQVDDSSTRRFQGSGLGLAISRQLAQLMGGDIALESAPGRGSCFVLTVPLRPAASPQATAALPSRQGRIASARILLAEDNEINQMVARRMLAKLGCADVVVAANGREAVDACRAGSFDLVLMDCQMPELDGLQATRELRALGQAMPILALTASATSGDRDACLAAGMDDYLTKPIELSVLANKIERWLAEHAEPLPPPAPPQLPASEADVFDPGVLETSFFGDTEIMAASREIFERQTQAGLDELETAIEAGDAGRLRFVAHRTRGSAGAVGAPRLAEVATWLEVTEGATQAAQRAALAAARRAFAGYLEATAPVEV